MYGPDEDDTVEHGGGPLRVPGWVRRPRWLPALDWRPSRGAAILGIAGLVIGLAAEYALDYRPLAQAVRPSRVTATTAASPAVPRPAAPSGPAASAGSSGGGLAQTGGVCSVQHGRELQVGIEVINLSATTVTLGQARPILPTGGLRAVAQQWAPCGAISPSWEVVGAGSTVMIIAVPVRATGPADVPGPTPPGGALQDDSVVPPGGAAWLSVTFQVLVACPRQLPVRFSVSYQENGRPATARLPGFPDLGQVSYTGCVGR